MTAPKMKPAGLSCFAIGVDVNGRAECLVYDGGDYDGAMICFATRKQAEQFIRDNDVEDTHFVVDLTDAGAH